MAQTLKIRGKAVVFIDWANVYHWKSALGYEIAPKNLFLYLKNYPLIKEINFYFGEDTGDGIYEKGHLGIKK